MLIDFRVRPPYKTNLTTSLYNKPAPSPDPTKQSIFLIGKERVPSAEARSPHRSGGHVLACRC